MNIMIILLIVLPLIIGILIFFLKKLEYLLSIFTSLILFLLSINLLFFENRIVEIKWVSEFGINFVFNADLYSVFSIILATLFVLLISLYSGTKNLFVDNTKKHIYFSLIMINLGIINGIFLSTNLVTFLIFWELAGIVLYLAIRFLAKKDNEIIATKTLYITGFVDFCLLLGIIMLIKISGTVSMRPFNYMLNSPYTITMFIFLVIGALGKVGSLPFHTWIPSAAERVPVPVATYLISVVDKLLGIYLLYKICGEIFLLKPNNGLMIIGLITIISAVFMALVQHDLKKLLSYHAVSQVGYMILGIGSGTVVGLAGGVFHMINNVIYKSCLFLSCGSVESMTGNSDLTDNGGLAKFMPITFITTLISALAISGVPPLNGFFSKWMVYQGVVESFSKTHSLVPILCLIGAMFGSALTLASFLKVVYSIFLSSPLNKNDKSEIKEVSFNMLLPMIFLSVSCIILGVFAFEIPLKQVIYPILSFSNIITKNIFSGSWQPVISTALIISGIFLGVVIYLILSFNKRSRLVKTYLYGEEEKFEGTVLPGTDFYISITEKEPFATIYFLARKKFFDFYNWAIGLVGMISRLLKFLFDRKIFDLYYIGKKIVFVISKFLSSLHRGNLHGYMSWIVIGLAIILLFLLK